MSNINQLTDDEKTVAYWRKALGDFPNDHGKVLRSGMDAALRELDRYRETIDLLSPYLAHKATCNTQARLDNFDPNAGCTCGFSDLFKPLISKRGTP